jgi:glutamine amidotransferase PdxT
MFIRAPIFTEIGKDVEVIAEVEWEGKKLVAAV